MAPATFFINGVRHDGSYDMPPWWQDPMRPPPTRAHSSSAGGIGAICIQKPSTELTTDQLRIEAPDYSVGHLPVQNLRREPWLPFA